MCNNIYGTPNLFNSSQQCRQFVLLVRCRCYYFFGYTCEVNILGTTHRTIIVISPTYNNECSSAEINLSVYVIQ